jgi:hypothetical protein
MDMPKIKNYAPGIFEHQFAETMGQADPYGNPETPINAMSTGFTKVRTNHMARPRQMNALSAYWSHLESVEYFIHFGELLRDVGAIFKSPELRRSIEGNYGLKTANLFSQWLEALENDGRFKAAQTALLAEINSNLLSAQSAVGLAYNVGTLIKQNSASLGAIMMMPTKDALHGLARFIANPSTYLTVWTSPSIQQRIKKGMNPEDRRLIEAAAKSPSLIIELLDYGRLPIAYADALFTSVAGVIAYNHTYQAALNSNLTESQAQAAALQHMDDVIVRTGQPATTQDKSMAELTAKGMGKFLFLFRSDPRQKLALSINAIAKGLRGDISKSAAARKFLWAWIIYGMLEQANTAFWRTISRDEDDPEHWQIRDFVAAAVAGPVSGYGIVGGAAQSAIFGIIGNGAFPNSMNPADAAINRLASSGISSSLYRTLQKEQPSLYDVLRSTSSDTGALALLAGVWTPKAAIIPAATRAARDAVGLATNAYKAAIGPQPEDIARRIIAETRETTNQQRADRQTQLDQLSQQYANLLLEDPTQAQLLLDRQDKETQRALLARHRRTDLTETQRALLSMSQENRAATIERILQALPESDREPYKQTLQAAGLLE